MFCQGHRFWFWFCVLSGQPGGAGLRLEEGRVGERPAVVYHVLHTLLFGFLTLLFDGSVVQSPARF